MTDRDRAARRHQVALRGISLAMVAAVLASACSSDDSSSSSTSTVSQVTTTDYPAVDIAQLVRHDIPTGTGVPQASATAPGGASAEGGAERMLTSGYTEEEYLIEGTAATYSGPASGPAQELNDANRYVTRVVVRYPKDESRFSGRVVLEPFNTSGGADNDVVWSSVASLLQAEGDAWVGVTERASSDAALKTADPERYAGVAIPSNDLAWDIMRQVGAAVKQGGPQSPLSGLEVRHLYLAGYSQSGIDVATFAMAFSKDTGTADGGPVYDGYFPAAHSGNVAPLQSGTAVLPTFESVPISPVEVPVIDVETQTDVEGFSVELSATSDYTNPGSASVRRDDNDEPGDLFRLYEIAGAPHAGKIPSCDGEGSTFPTRVFLGAALELLFRWAEDGVPPPTAPRIDLETLDIVSIPNVDEYGNAVGGVRSPFVDVPLVRYDVHSTPGPLCQISSRETRLAPDVLLERYGDPNRYMDEFTASLDATIDAGFILSRDRSAIIQTQQAKAAAAFGE